MRSYAGLKINLSTLKPFAKTYLRRALAHSASSQRGGVKRYYKLRISCSDGEKEHCQQVVLSKNKNKTMYP